MQGDYVKERLHPEGLTVKELRAVIREEVRNAIKSELPKDHQENLFWKYFFGR